MLTAMYLPVHEPINPDGWRAMIQVPVTDCNRKRTRDSKYAVRAEHGADFSPAVSETVGWDFSLRINAQVWVIVKEGRVVRSRSVLGFFFLVFLCEAVGGSCGEV